MSFINELSLRQTADIEDRTNSAIDLDQWVNNLDPTDQNIIQGRLEGRSGTEIAGNIGISMSSCYSRLRQLGRRLTEDTGIEIPAKT